jgi:four helix bundle protein
MRYVELIAWQCCHRLVLAVYDATQSWPDHERYGLISQVRRAAVSAAANIVEGSTRQGSREFRRFLDLARGSLSETKYLMLVAKELGYVIQEDYAKLEPLMEEASKVTWGLYASIRDA